MADCMSQQRRIQHVYDDEFRKLVFVSFFVGSNRTEILDLASPMVAPWYTKAEISTSFGIAFFRSSSEKWCKPNFGHHGGTIGLAKSRIPALC